jgi:8-oxo-dGTP pyrophosphatase MutT (NUDIX family)
MAKDKFHGTTQFAALPWRISEGGTRQVMLLTSRETRRWVIPKGWPMKKRKPAEVASQEAYEEAGLIGQIVGKRPFGSFHYAKLVATEAVLCQVRVFLLRVEQQLDDWPEKRERETKWFEAKEAASLVDEGGLAEIIARFSEPYIRFAAFRGSQRHRPFSSIRHGGRSPSGD